MTAPVDLDWTRDCVARHLGLWAVEPIYLRRQLAELKAFLLRPEPQVEGQARAIAPPGRPYQVDPGGVAIINMAGPLIKGFGKYGEVNTLDVRRAMRAAAADEEVSAIMMVIDSPGGTLAGTEELAAAVRAAAAKKPVFAHFDDLGASAAYWVAAQVGPGRITANATAEVGSIGVVAVVDDISGAMAAEGMVMHVLSTGPFKGSFVPGAPVTPDQIAYMQGLVDAAGQEFFTAVQKGRGVSAKKVESWADGRVFPAATALEMGLIDGVMLLEQALAAARKAAPKRSARSAITRAEIAAAENV